MAKYYYSDGTDQHGPFTLEELRSKNIEAGTLVWYEGMKDWQPASELPEFAGWFGAATPPPTASGQIPTETRPTYASSQTYLQKPPKNWLIESVLVTLFCCLPLGIVGIINAAKVDSKFRAGDMAGAEESAKEAAKWVKIGFFVGLVFIVFYLIYIFATMSSIIGGGF